MLDAWKELDLSPQDIIPWGRDQAKISWEAVQRRSRNGQLILVSAMSPSPAGEGKTTVAIGLVDALRRQKKRAVVAVREPSMGPVFGMKGGGTGGGRAQVVPAESINLHFTGDLHAITSAHNLLAAALDNHMHQGNALKLDVRRLIWHRVLDMNDRSLRQCVVGLGGRIQGVPREERFDITAASEVMAILALSRSWEDLRQRLSRIVIGFNPEGPVKAEQLGVAGAMAALLRDALLPNLVQTLEGSPALVHCGPFANIAHGTNSILATQAGLGCADFVVQEAGFGADLGGEKFLDIFARELGQAPALAVLVATVRGIKYHGGKPASELDQPDMASLERGMANPLAQLQRLHSQGPPVVVALNLRDSDPPEEVRFALEQLRQAGYAAFPVNVYTQGGAGALELAEYVSQFQTPAQLQPTYQKDQPLRDKILQIAQKIYGAGSVEYSKAAARQLRGCEELGYGDSYVCMAKTQYSFTDDPALVGVPRGFALPIRSVYLSAGAGFVVPVAGDMMTMPGLPKRPNYLDIDLTPDGRVVGVAEPKRELVCARHKSGLGGSN